MIDRRQHLTGLAPGAQSRPKGVARMRRRGPFNSVVLLWFAAVVVVIFEFSTHFLFNKPSRPTAPLVVQPKPEDSPAREYLANSPIFGKKSPGLRRQGHDYAGKSAVAVPDSFSNSKLPAEKTQLAGDLEVFSPARNSAVVAGSDYGNDDLAPHEVREQFELVASPQVDAGPLAVASIAEAEILERAPVPEADLLEAARTALAAGAIVEGPAVASRESERPGPPPGFPKYEILFQTEDPLGRRVYGEVLVPELSPQTPKRERRRIARAIAELEGLDDLTLYCTRQAREAHYSMDYSDAHPDALAGGLLGSLERGRFEPYHPR